MIHAAVLRKTHVNGIEMVEGMAFKIKGERLTSRFFQMPLDEVFTHDVNWHDSPGAARDAAMLDPPPSHPLAEAV